MLTLLLAPSDGGSAWRQVLAAGEARAGWQCVGPRGLVRRLGSILGIPAEPAPAADRLGAYAARLDRHDDGARSYSASRRVDPFGVAAYLLALRDRLRLAGWSGNALGASARLRDLAAVEALEPALPPGLCDVAGALAAEVERRRALPFPIAVHLSATRAGYAPLLLRLLDAFAAAGATVTDVAADEPLARADTDLGRVQRALLDPAAGRPRLTGDGSFLLLETDTPIDAADLAASFARAADLTSTTFVASAERGVLDAALARQGLPTLGLATSSPLRPHLQVLPLRLALAFRPQDPFRAAELLLLPGAPLPGYVRSDLLEALNEMPGVGSPAWKTAVDALVERETERVRAAGGANPEAAGATLRERIDAWFGGELFEPGSGIPAGRAATLCEHMARWAGGRVKGAQEAAGEEASADASLWAQAVAVAGALERLLLARPPGERIGPLALMQLHDQALGGGSDLSAFAPEAGRPAVATEPAGLQLGAATVVWWGFLEEADPGPAPEPWTGEERAALAAAGLQLQAPGELRGFEAWGWRRPLLAARERAVLVRWRLCGAKSAAPHPFADELATRLATGSLAACTFDPERLLARGEAPWEVRAEPVRPADPVVPRGVWHVPPGALAPTGRLSSSQLESLLGCPFKWALEHQGLLQPGRGVDLPDEQRLLGNFAHRILQDLLLGPDRLDLAAATEESAVAWAGAAFDARVASEAAPFVRRGREVELDRGRATVAGAAAALLRHLQDGGWEVRAAEQPVSGSFAGQPVVGYVDLVLERRGKPAVLDLKLSGGGYRRRELEEGRALQLALYARMLEPGGTLPPAGFLVLDDGELLTVNPGAFPGATVIAGPSAHETLGAAEEGFRYWKKVLSAGLLPVLNKKLEWEDAVTEATGAPPPDAKGPARREPACNFCRFPTLCKVGFGEGA